MNFFKKKIVSVKSAEVCQNYLEHAEHEFSRNYTKELINQIKDRKEIIQTNFGFFKQNVQIFDDILKTLELYLNRPTDYVYDKYSEMKRLIQLNAEETIVYIKQSNDVDINTVESQLEPKLLNQVNVIIEQSQTMIDRVEEFQKNISESYLHNKAPKDKNLIIKLKELEDYSKKCKNELFSKFIDIIQQTQSSMN